METRKPKSVSEKTSDDSMKQESSGLVAKEKKGHAGSSSSLNHPLHFINDHKRRNKSFGSGHEPGTI